ncbi:hypothetical protein IAU60_004071 [Kwoniella sp. DSM 27419]
MADQPAQLRPAQRKLITYIAKDGPTDVRSGFQEFDAGISSALPGILECSFGLDTGGRYDGHADYAGSYYSAGTAGLVEDSFQITAPNDTLTDTTESAWSDQHDQLIDLPGLSNASSVLIPHGGVEHTLEGISIPSFGSIKTPVAMVKSKNNGTNGEDSPREDATLAESLKQGLSELKLKLPPPMFRDRRVSATGRSFHIENDPNVTQTDSQGRNGVTRGQPTDNGESGESHVSVDAIPAYCAPVFKTALADDHHSHAADHPSHGHYKPLSLLTVFFPSSAPQHPIPRTQTHPSIVYTVSTPTPPGRLARARPYVYDHHRNTEYLRGYTSRPPGTSRVIQDWRSPIDDSPDREISRTALFDVRLPVKVSNVRNESPVEPVHSGVNIIRTLAQAQDRIQELQRKVVEVEAERDWAWSSLVWSSQVTNIMLTSVDYQAVTLALARLCGHFIGEPTPVQPGSSLSSLRICDLLDELAEAVYTPHLPASTSSTDQVVDMIFLRAIHSLMRPYNARIPLKAINIPEDTVSFCAPPDVLWLLVQTADYVFFPALLNALRIVLWASYDTQRGAALLMLFCRLQRGQLRWANDNRLAARAQAAVFLSNGCRFTATEPDSIIGRVSPAEVQQALHHIESLREKTLFDREAGIQLVTAKSKAKSKRLSNESGASHRVSNTGTGSKKRVSNDSDPGGSVKKTRTAPSK